MTKMFYGCCKLSDLSDFEPIKKWVINERETGGIFNKTSAVRDKKNRINGRGRGRPIGRGEMGRGRGSIIGERGRAPQRRGAAERDRIFRGAGDCFNFGVDEEY